MFEKILERADLLKMWLDKNSLKEGASFAIQQEVEHYVHHKIADVDDLNGLKRIIVAIPDPLLRGSAAFVAGMLQVPDGTFKSPLVSAAYDIMLSPIVGVGRGLADIPDPKAQMLAKLDELEREWQTLGEHDWNIHPHVTVRDSAGHDVSDCIELKAILAVEHERESWRLSVRNARPDNTVRFRVYTLQEAIKQNKAPCPSCMLRHLRGMVPDKAAVKPWQETLTEDDIMMHVRIIAIIKDGMEADPPRFSARDLSILQSDDRDAGWWTLPSVEAYRAPMRIGLVNGLPTDETAHALINAVDVVGRGAPSLWSRVVDAFGKGDLSPAWEFLGKAKDSVAGAVSLPAMLYLGALITSLLVFFVGGWVFGFWWLALPGMVGVYLCTRLFWPVEGLTAAVAGLLPKESGLRKALEGPWLTGFARDLESFTFIYGSFVAFVCFIDLMWWSRLLLGIAAVLNIACRDWVIKIFPDDDDNKLVKGWNKKTIWIVGKISLVLIVWAIIFVPPNSWMKLEVFETLNGKGEVVGEKVLLGQTSRTFEDVFGADAVRAGQVRLANCKPVRRGGARTCLVVMDKAQGYGLPFGYRARRSEWLSQDYQAKWWHGPVRWFGYKPSGKVTVEFSTAYWKQALLSFTEADSAQSFPILRWLALIGITLLLALAAVISAAVDPKEELGIAVKNFFALAAVGSFVFLLASVFVATGKSPRVFDLIGEEAEERVELAFADEEEDAKVERKNRRKDRALSGSGTTAPAGTASAGGSPPAASVPAPRPRARSVGTAALASTSAATPEDSVCHDPRLTARIKTDPTWRSRHHCQ